MAVTAEAYPRSTMDSTEVVFQSFADRGGSQAASYLPRLAAAQICPPIVDQSRDGVFLRRGVRLPDWVATAGPDEVATMRPLVIDVVRRLHSEGVCHRDLHWENVVAIDGQPFLIDLEHACDVDPAWPCYDFTGPSAEVPLLQAHARFGGVLGTTGMWWGAELDLRWADRYRPLGKVFGPLN